MHGVEGRVAGDRYMGALGGTFRDWLGPGWLALRPWLPSRGSLRGAVARGEPALLLAGVVAPFSLPDVQLQSFPAFLPFGSHRAP